MKFVIRDDDACGFTNPEEIQACYGRIWQDVPVSLSVTPFRVPGHDKNVPDRYQGSMDVLPLERNTEMVQFIREGVKGGKLDVTLHGYHHWCCEGRPEFIAGEDLAVKAREGKAYLEKLLGVDIWTFVPPNNGISRMGLTAIINAEMNLAGILRLWSPQDRRVTIRSLSLYPRVMWHQKIRDRHYPFILDLGDHKELSCHTVGPRSSCAKLRQELNYCHDADGIFVLATHYHAFERQTDDGFKVGRVVHELVDMAATFPGTEFVGFNTIWQCR